MKCIRKCVQTAVILAFLSSAANAAVIQVPAGGNLQAALNQAQPGDTIVLQAGAKFVGQFKFPAKAGMVTLTSSGPLPDRRITPGDAPLLATIASGTTMMAFDLYDAKNWTIDGMRFEGNTGGYGDIVGIWRGENIVLRRLLIVIPDPQEQKRFITGNGRHITLTQSHCSGIWRAGQDSQCFGAWDGAGPYTITDNFLEAASENVMFGGADSISADNVPSDILVENNLFTKRLEWKGKPRVVKNLFELKAARRVVVRNNVFERNWIDGQAGTAIVFTPRNQDGQAPWSVIEDVLFEYNIVRDTVAHFNILGYDDIKPSGQTTNITVRHNLLLGTGGRLGTIGNEVATLVFDHNTFVNPQVWESSMISLYAEGSIATPNGTRTPQFAVNHFTFTNNMVQGNTYGLHSSAGAGTAALTGMTRGYSWTNNVVAGGSGQYPSVTTFVTVAEYPTHFDAAYYLALTSRFRSMATDGTDIGWNRPTPTATLPVVIGTATLPGGKVGSAYSVTLTASGGSGTVTWDVVFGALPAGLTLNGSTGTISGTPTSAGTSSFSIRAADIADATNDATASYSLKVIVPVAITTTSIPNGQVTTAYNTMLGANGGTGNFRWSLSSGTLPPGLSLGTDTGAISGTPQTACTNTFTITARDAADTLNSASATFTMHVSSGGVTITTTSLPAGRATLTYAATVAASGGSGALAWAVTGGVLPAGLTLDSSTGQIAGTLTTAGSSTFTLRACDAADGANCASADYTVNVAAAIALTTASLPNPVRGQAYSATLSASSAVGTVSWKIGSGALPLGLSLNAATGVISGTATNNAAANFVVTVTDSSTSASRQFALKVSNK